MQTTHMRRGPGFIRLALATLFMMIAAFVIADAALARNADGDPVAYHPGEMPDCTDGATEFAMVDGLGWAEVALRDRRLIDAGIERDEGGQRQDREGGLSHRVLSAAFGVRARHRRDPD